jgi:hypothetical protein
MLFLTLLLPYIANVSSNFIMQDSASSIEGDNEGMKIQ